MLTQLYIGVVLELFHGLLKIVETTKDVVSFEDYCLEARSVTEVHFVPMLVDFIQVSLYDFALSAI